MWPPGPPSRVCQPCSVLPVLPAWDLLPSGSSSPPSLKLRLPPLDRDLWTAPPPPLIWPRGQGGRKLFRLSNHLFRLRFKPDPTAFWLSCQSCSFLQGGCLPRPAAGSGCGRPQDPPRASAAAPPLEGHLASPGEQGLERRRPEGGRGGTQHPALPPPLPASLYKGRCVRRKVCRRPPAPARARADRGPPKGGAAGAGVEGTRLPRRSARRPKAPGARLAAPRGPALTVSGSFSNTSRASSRLHSSSTHSLSRWPCLASSKTW